MSHGEVNHLWRRELVCHDRRGLGVYWGRLRLRLLGHGGDQRCQRILVLGDIFVRILNSLRSSRSSTTSVAFAAAGASSAVSSGGKAPLLFMASILPSLSPKNNKHKNHRTPNPWNEERKKTPSSCVFIFL
jgi:hypothetical protein